MPGDTSIGDEAVRAKTGRTWSEWFALLDAWGALAKGHKATARHLADEHGVGDRWSQMVTVAYERERGGRQVGERADGTFEAGSVVDVTFEDRGIDRTVVRLTHKKLASAADRADMIGGWSWAMDSYKAYLDTGAGIPHEAWLRNRVGGTA